LVATPFCTPLQFWEAHAAVWTVHFPLAQTASVRPVVAQLSYRHVRLAPPQDVALVGGDCGHVGGAHSVWRTHPSKQLFVYETTNGASQNGVAMVHATGPLQLASPPAAQRLKRAQQPALAQSQVPGST
jgi:hypothetical protein